MGDGIFHIHDDKSTASTETDLEGVVCKVAPAAQAPAADMVLKVCMWDQDKKQVIMARIMEEVDKLIKDSEMYNRDKRRWGDEYAKEESAKRNPKGRGYVWKILSNEH